MQWVLAFNLIEYENAQALMVDQDGAVVVFTSRKQAEDFVKDIEEDPEEIMIMPEIEAH